MKGKLVVGKSNNFQICFNKNKFESFFVLGPLMMAQKCNLIIVLAVNSVRCDEKFSLHIYVYPLSFYIDAKDKETVKGVFYMSELHFS